jgi:hypothetical protein
MNHLKIAFSLFSVTFMESHILNYIRVTDFCTLMYLLYHCAINSMKEVSYLETKELGSENVHCIHLPMFLLE